MNLDEIFGLQESDYLVATNPLLLLACIATAVLAAWICVLKYRDTYAVEKSIKLYLPFAAAGAVIFTLVGIPVLFSIGAQLCGLVALLLISNHYFKE